MLIICLIMMAAPCQAKDHVWIIGGGADISSSEVSIEKQVIWIRQVLENLPGERIIKVYFADADDSGKDVVSKVALDANRLELQPLARVFGEQQDNLFSFESNTVGRLSGGTEKEKLVKALNQDFQQVRSGDRSFFIFYGHGLVGKDKQAGNTIRLWKNTTLSVSELDTLVSQIPLDVPIGFFFPQCYSGGFERIVHPGARSTLRLSPALRYGFFAQSEDRKSEG